MDITLEQLQNVGNDLNKVLKLEPPINTAFEPTAKGAAAKSQEKKFFEDLRKEIVQLAEYQDAETGKYDLQSGDLQLLQPETVEIVRFLSPATATRFDEITGTKNKTTSGAKKKKTRSATDIVIKELCKNPESTVDELKNAIKAGDKKMADATLETWPPFMKKIFDNLKEVGWTAPAV